MKPLNSGHLRVLKNLSVIKRCLLLRGSLTKIVTFWAKNFVCYLRHVRFLGCPLLGGFTVFSSIYFDTFVSKSEKKKIELFTKIFELYQVLKWPDIHKILLNCIHYKYYSIKIGSISFFPSSGTQIFHHLLGCHNIDINYLLIIF